MKKQIVLLIAAVTMAGFMTAQAQGGNFPRRSVEERVKAVMEKFDEFKFDDAKKAELDSIFTRSFKAQDAKREEFRASGSSDREAMRAEFQKIQADRDEKLKKVLSEAEFKDWKEKIEPSLRPQRQGGGGNN